jgi:hypothetical protein
MNWCGLASHHLTSPVESDPTNSKHEGTIAMYRDLVINDKTVPLGSYGRYTVNPALLTADAVAQLPVDTRLSFVPPLPLPSAQDYANVRGLKVLTKTRASVEVVVGWEGDPANIVDAKTSASIARHLIAVRILSHDDLRIIRGAGRFQPQCFAVSQTVKLGSIVDMLTEADQVISIALRLLLDFREEVRQKWSAVQSALPKA